MIKKHKKEDVEWFSFENKIAFDLETLLSCLSNEEKEICLQFLN